MTACRDWDRDHLRTQPRTLGSWPWRFRFVGEHPWSCQPWCWQGGSTGSAQVIQVPGSGSCFFCCFADSCSIFVKVDSGVLQRDGTGSYDYNLELKMNDPWSINDIEFEWSSIIQECIFWAWNEYRLKTWDHGRHVMSLPTWGGDL